MVDLIIGLVRDGGKVVLEGGDTQAGVELRDVIINGEGIFIDLDRGDGSHGALCCCRTKDGFRCSIDNSEIMKFHVR